MATIPAWLGCVWRTAPLTSSLNGLYNLVAFFRSGSSEADPSSSSDLRGRSFSIMSYGQGILQPQESRRDSVKYCRTLLRGGFRLPLRIVGPEF